MVLNLGQGACAWSDGRLVGTAMWWVYGDVQARLGMVIVDPAIQRSGIGRALMDKAMAQISARSVVLNATKAGEPLYRRIGFVPDGMIAQHQGIAASGPLVHLPERFRIRPMGRSDADMLVTLDAAAFGTRREAVIGRLIDEGDAVILVQGEEPVGFAFQRRFGRGHVIGPVIARSGDEARALIAYWVAVRAGGFLRIDVPEDGDLPPWLENLGLPRAGGALTMIRGLPLRAVATPRIHALATQALG